VRVVICYTLLTDASHHKINKKFAFIELTSFKSFDSGFHAFSLDPFADKPFLQKR